jgi:hypothetical protein
MINKDWIGNKKSTFVTLGSSSHTDSKREENDYYATDPICAKELYELGLGLYNVWEPSCGEGHLARFFDEQGILAKATDLIDRGYGEQADFLKQETSHDGWIVTNPPYKYAQEFCEKAITLSGNVAMFLKLTFLEGQKRKLFFKKHPPKYVYVYSARRKCAINGNFESVGSSAAAYAWFVWEKDFFGQPIIEWI